MDIVFIHGNYPAQFVHLARILGAQGRHRVVYLTNRADPEVWPLPGVEVRRYDLHREVGRDVHPYLRSSEQAVLNGQAVARALGELIGEGYRPRLILAHGGNGLQLFIKKVWPHGRLINYIEWYFNDDVNAHLVPSYGIDQQCRFSVRNWVIQQELESCDVAVTPTAWQWQQFPATYRDKIRIIFDGVDTDFFKPYEVRGDLALAGDGLAEPLVIHEQQRLLTYATRGMEPLRGFPEFMRMLPPLLQRYPDLQVVVAGQDRIAYSYPPNDGDGSWKSALLAELGGFEGRDRVHFVGSLNYRDYMLMLCRTDLHVYFTRPYITSWGLFQAAACGTHLLVNAGPATDDVLPAGTAAAVVDLDDQKAIATAAEDWLATALERRGQPRQSLLQPAWELGACLQEWQGVLSEQIQLSDAELDQAE